MLTVSHTLARFATMRLSIGLFRSQVEVDSSNGPTLRPIP